MSNEKLITIPLSEFIDDLLSWRDRCKIPEERAKQILAIDPEEDLCHIQVPGAESMSYVIWRIKDWRDSEKKRIADKLKSEKHRQEWTIFKENIRLGVNTMWLISGMDKKDLVPIVYKMLKKNPKSLIALGCNGLRLPYVPSDSSSVLQVEFEGGSVKL